MLSTTNQNPSTLDLWTMDGDDLWLSWLSIPLKERTEEQVSGWRDIGNAIGLVGAIGGPIVGGDGEKLDLGACTMIPFRLEDLDMFFPAIAPGSCNGNLHEYFKSCIVFKYSKTFSLWAFLMDPCEDTFGLHQPLSELFGGNLAFNWGSMISDNLQSSAKKGRLHLTKFISSLGWRLSRFFLPVSNSRSTMPKHQTLLLGVSTPLSSVSTDTFANAW